jgi:putative heme iron utilization protein
VTDPGDEAATAAAAARKLVASARAGALATVSEDGGPWSSLVACAALPDGSPVLLLSSLAEHGRNLRRDPRASLLVVEAGAGGQDPLERGRVTLTGRAEPPHAAAAEDARAAFVAQVAGAAQYAGFGDFALYVLRVERVRWVGGFGRMRTVPAAAYRAAAP